MGSSPPQGFKDCLKPHLRLFLSVDIVNSTAIKYNNHSEQQEDQSWLIHFAQFFVEFPNTFAGNLNKKRNEFTRIKNIEEPLIWKRLGDELVFTVPLSHNRHAYIYIAAFKESIEQFNKTPKKDGVVFSLKGTAWIAGFPVFNAIIPPIQNNANTTNDYDYIGPAMDIGFRLSKLSTKQKFVISMELAWLLSSRNEIKIHYGGEVELNGFQGLKDYPLFWINQNEDDGSIENEMLRSVDGDKIRRYCNQYFDISSQIIPRPFIIDDEDLGDSIPKDYKDRHDAAIKMYNNVWEKYDKMLEDDGTHEDEEARKEIKQLKSKIADHVNKRLHERIK